MWKLIASLALCAACARPDPGLRAALPHPAVSEGIVREDVALRAGDGLELYAQRWRGEAPPLGVLVIVHGLKDHSDRYSAMAEAVVRAGYAVYALDLRGHGRSPGPRVTIDRFERYVEDVAGLVEVARGDAPDVPLFVLGHSMGGVITARLVQTRARGDVAGVILSAPAIGLDAPAFQAAAVVAAGGPVAGRLPGFEPPTRQFASRREVTEDMARDPLIHNAKAPVHTAAQLITAMGKVWEQAQRMSVPIVILHGTADRLTAPAASRDFLELAAISDRTLLLYEGAWHDLAHEPAAPRITADVIAWMDARRAGPGAWAPLPARELRGDRVGLMQRTHVRGARIVDGGGTSLDATVGFAAGRTVMVGLALEGRLGLTDPATSGGLAALGLGTRLGTHGWLLLGAGYARREGLNRPLAHGELAIAPRRLPVALHLRGLGTRTSGDVRVETELTLRVPGNRIFWGRGRRGAGLALGVRTVDGPGDRIDGLAITLGLETTGFD
jgi:alpha-beta hydrolase superfamily lysophospholipase